MVNTIAISKSWAIWTSINMIWLFSKNNENTFGGVGWNMTFMKLTIDFYS